MKDYLVRGIVESKNCRVFACQTTNLLEEARAKHGLWPTASAALGRVMSATLMMAAMNKNNEKMTITINGGGPIGTILATTHSDGKIKAFVANPEVHYTYNDTGKLAVGVAVGKEGSLQVIKDMGLKEPFVGTVPLQSGEIGDDFSYYFMASEQIPSVVSVGVLVNDTNEILSSGGFIIQLLPNATDEDIQFIEERMKDFPPVSALIHEGKTPEDILKVIFEDVEISLRYSNGDDVTDNVTINTYSLKYYLSNGIGLVLEMDSETLKKVNDRGLVLNIKCNDGKAYADAVVNLYDGE